jgi:glycosyltransferase involved in cell wall biosynthesis
MSQAASFRVAVITPYFRESLEILRQCLVSVAAQTYECIHFLIADGYPQDLSTFDSVEHVILPRAHGDCGNTARAIGCMTAMNQGFDALAFLDADNWYYPAHIERMVALHRVKGAAVCTATRSIHRADGSLMGTDMDESDGKNHVDTSCLFLTRSAFRVLPLWAMMPIRMGPACDRIMWEAIVRRGYRTAHDYPEPTVAFRTQYESHYLAIGEQPPPGSKTFAGGIGAAMQWWNSLPVEERNAWYERMGQVTS